MKKSQYIKPEVTMLYMEFSSILCVSYTPEAISNGGDVNVQSSNLQDIAVSSPWDEAI